MTLMKTANQSTVTVSGHDVELRKGGAGPALLWLHGGEGFGTYDPPTGPLAEKFTVYAPSPPGFFGTSRPDPICWQRIRARTRTGIENADRQSLR